MRAALAVCIIAKLVWTPPPRLTHTHTHTHTTRACACETPTPRQPMPTQPVALHHGHDTARGTLQAAGGLRKALSYAQGRAATAVYLQVGRRRGRRRGDGGWGGGTRPNCRRAYGTA